MTVKIWRISQTVIVGTDTYDSAIVAAETSREAQLVHPANHRYQDPMRAAVDGHRWSYGRGCWLPGSGRDPSLADSMAMQAEWPSPADVKVELVGEAADGIEAGAVLVASFNAG